MTKTEYDKEYYDTQLGPVPCHLGQPEWETHFECIADAIALYSPESVIDVGCSFGMLVHYLREKHAINAVGIDISKYAISKADTLFCSVGDILTYKSHQQYSLAVCIEVLEHLLQKDVHKAIANLCKLSDIILFSSTPDDKDTESHQTVLTLGQWDLLFQRHGYQPVPNEIAKSISPHARMYILMSRGRLNE